MFVPGDKPKDYASIGMRLDDKGRPEPYLISTGQPVDFVQVEWIHGVNDIIKARITVPVVYPESECPQA